MPDLSIYVVETIYDGNIVLFNTVTKKWLPHIASHDELAAWFFLKGQERQAIESALAIDYGVLGLTIIPSWECNLRCKHCSVMSLLTPSQPEQLDPFKVVAFTQSYIAKYFPQWVTIDFVGGEPLLRAKTCVAIVKQLQSISGVRFARTMTTNASVEFDDACWELCELLTEISISVDGNEAQHNSQRIPFKMAGIINPYNMTISNLREMVNRGYANKIKIKAALKDEYLTKQNGREFFRGMAKLGINVDNITYGCQHPTDHTDATKLRNFQNNFGRAAVARPCCKYRLSNQYLIEADHNIYDVPFKWARHKLGTLDDDIEAIVATQRQVIAQNFVCFGDAKCMQCPAIGYCWGGCVTANPMHNGRPSDYCRQATLQDLIAKSAAAGDLIEETEKRFPLHMLSVVR